MAGASKIKESASLVSYEGQMLLDSFSQGGEQEREELSDLMPLS